MAVRARLKKVNLRQKKRQAYRAKLTQAVEAGYKVLEQGGGKLRCYNGSDSSDEAVDLF